MESHYRNPCFVLNSLRSQACITNARTLPQNEPPDCVLHSAQIHFCVEEAHQWNAIEPNPLRLLVNAHCNSGDAATRGKHAQALHSCIHCCERTYNSAPSRRDVSVMPVFDARHECNRLTSNQRSAHTGTRSH